MKYLYLHRYPSLRLAIPWMAGVFCKEQWSGASVGLLDSLWTFLFCAVLVAVLYPLKQHRWRWCFGVACVMACFVGGWGRMAAFQQQVIYPFPNQEAVYQVHLLEDGRSKSRSIFFPAWVESRRDSLQTVPVARKVYLYFASDSAAALLRAGDKLWVSTRLSLREGGPNFDAFDYGRYLWHRGISASGYVAARRWQRYGQQAVPVFPLQAEACRQRVVALYRDLGFETDERAVMAALTVGDKSELSDTLQESYSVAGVSHVLALSGLHIGLIYALLNGLLTAILVCWGRWGCWLRLVLILGGLWAFAYMTGFSPSVVRSVCMFSLVGIAELFSRRSLTLHTLLVVAWGMVLIRPTWLFDVGFQLSFAAVTAILLLQPALEKHWSVKHPVGRFFRSLLTVSLAAQLGTAPLVLFYFSRFSSHFLWTNLVVVPLVTLILYLTLLMLCLTPLPGLQVGVAWGCRMLLQALNRFVQEVEQWPLASIDGLWMDAWEVVAFYVLCWLAWYVVRKRRACYLAGFLGTVFAVIVAHQYNAWQYRPRCSLVFYRCERCPAVHCLEADGRSWLYIPATSPDSLYVPDPEALQQVAGRYWQHQRLLPPAYVNGSETESSFARRQQLITFHGCRVAMVADNRWQGCTASVPLAVQYLYLCRGFTGRLEELLSLFAPECVVLDASLSDYRCERYIQVCQQFRLPFISLSDKGSVCFLL